MGIMVEGRKDRDHTKCAFLAYKTARMVLLKLQNAINAFSHHIGMILIFREIFIFL